jgi:hypothetical protein
LLVHFQPTRFALADGKLGMKITFEKISARQSAGGLGDHRALSGGKYAPPNLFIPNSILTTSAPAPQRGKPPIKLGKVFQDLLLVIATGLGLATAGFLLLFVNIQ